jgi:pilus assembly protein CpaF
MNRDNRGNSGGLTAARPNAGQAGSLLNATRLTPVDRLAEVKKRIHRQLLQRLNLSNLDGRSREEAAGLIRPEITSLLAAETEALNLEDRESLIQQILDEIFGLGPLEPLMHDAEISDIMVNGPKRVYIEKRGKLFETDVAFQDVAHLRQVIDRIVSNVGRRIDDSSPMVDARLPDGSRVNAVIQPVALDGPYLSIRKFKRDTLSGEDLLRAKSLTEPMLQLLDGVVKARLNVLISGGTGAGKTTLLNILSSSIPEDESIVTIEDSAELQLRQPNVRRMETRPPNIDGRGEISQRNLVINALRMRPDRIIIGEVRGAEAVDMLQAMNTGHDGSLTTLHANTPRDALSRLETMVSMSALRLPERAMRQQIASAIDIVIQVSRLSDGTRKVISVSEITGMEGDVVSMQEIFVFERQGTTPEGDVIGRFKPTGIRPKAADRLAQYGIKLAELLFSENLQSPGIETGGRFTP